MLDGDKSLLYQLQNDIRDRFSIFDLFLSCKIIMFLRKFIPIS